MKAEGTLPRRLRLRRCKYLNNVIEQDHRTVKKRTWLAKGYGSFQSAWRTLEGIETMSMIRKGRVRRVTKGDVVAEANSFSASSLSLPNFSSTLIAQQRLRLTSTKLRNETRLGNRILLSAVAHGTYCVFTREETRTDTRLFCVKRYKRFSQAPAEAIAMRTEQY